METSAAATGAPAPPATRLPASQPPEVKDTPLYTFGRMMLRPWSDLWFDLKVYHPEYVPRKGGVLVVANHQSYLDPILLAVKIARPFSFLAKSELFENPFFGWMISRLNAFPVRQGEGDIGAVKETIRRLQEGHALIVYPEGTRSLSGEIEEIQPGIGLIARRAGVPVVPAVIDGSYAAWPKGATLFHPHSVRVLYGPALDLKHMKASQVVKKVDQTLRSMHAELRRMDPVLSGRALPRV
ncbi:MAG: lysophospholipid acyltransferase family protein [Tepidisphaeraceae bacterium]